MDSDAMRALAPADVQATFCRTLVRQWAALGIDRAFVAPGSRSTPLALALATDPRWSVEVFLDERSAAFAALGAGLATGRPSVVLCTSGTAAAHFHAAVIEADLSCVPLLVVTADRPPELRDVGAAQTIDQTNLFNNSVRWFHDPGVAAAEASGSWRSLAARCIHRTLGPRPGPVHLNLPFREPLLGRAIEIEGVDAPVGSLQGDAHVDSDSLAEVITSFAGRRGVVIAGRGAPREVALAAAALGWPVLADARAAVQDEAIRCFDSLLRHESFASTHRPDIVLRFGEGPASKVLAQWITTSGARQIFVTDVDRWIDVDHRIDLRIQVDPVAVCEAIARAASVAPAEWSSSWNRASELAQGAISRGLANTELSGPVIARRFAEGLPNGAGLVVSSSMPIRDLEWFGGALPHIRVHSNRGANGIDGVLATAIGVAVASGAPTGVLIGDVAFLHDSSSLAALARRDVDVRIMVVDNDGGGIFHFLPQASAIDPSTFETLFGTPHGTDLAALASAHGLTTTTIENVDDIARFVRTPGPSVAVVRTNRDADVEIHRRLHRSVADALDSGANQR